MGNALASVSLSNITAQGDDNREDYDLSIHLDSLDTASIEQGWPIKISRDLQIRTLERLKFKNFTPTPTPPPSATVTADEITDQSRASTTSHIPSVVIEDPRGILSTNFVRREEDVSTEPFADVESLFTENPACIVSAVGPAHQGKSHILNTLSGSFLRTGKSQPTEGICFKIPKRNTGRDWLLIDTQGWGGPISKENIRRRQTTLSEERPKNKNEQEIFELKRNETILATAIEDKLKTEAIIDDFVFNVSHFVLLVTGETNYQDQKKLIEMSLKKKTEINPTDGKAYGVSMIVVHNYKDIDNMTEFNRMVQYYVIDAFPGELRSREVSGGFAPFFASGDINHVFLAKDYSEPGRKYNSLTYQLLRTWLATPSNIDRINSISGFITQNMNIALTPHVPNLRTTEITFVEKLPTDTVTGNTEDDMTFTDSSSEQTPRHLNHKPRQDKYDLSNYGSFVLRAKTSGEDEQ